MARIEFAPAVTDDIDRIVDHLLQHDIKDAAARVQDIICAIDILDRHPLIGRQVEAGKRELVIGRDARGYVALYIYVAEIDTAFVLALRSQTEAGYTQQQ
ncbi:MAG TPA: type II toxin-antitoxin system RelE/ParE family toxin [Rhodanobacter sp.]